jgi:Zn finger protein HypA/HybF involved in hydrogenase expression
MHEMSVALEVCRMAEERIDAAALGGLRVVALQVGDDCGLEPDNLAFCLDALLTQPPFGSGRAQLHRCAGDVLRVDYFEVDDGDPDD